MKRSQLIIGGLGAAGGAGLATYLLLRPQLHRWGATDDEVQRALPGDEIIAEPGLNFTLAITVETPIEALWPWIVQIGQGRGGWYSYDWLENLMGLGIHTADRILPQYQQLEPGDVIPTGGVDIPVLAVEPPRLLLLGGAPFSTIAFVLEPIDEQRTRLLFRNRAAFDTTPASMFWRVVLDPGIFIMSRKMLLVIKQRAERVWQPDATRRSSGVQQPSHARLRRFNRRILNPLVLRFAGRSHLPYSVVGHVGRRSGRQFRTPVVAIPIAGGFLIPLPYGAATDWCQNVLAAGGCTIERDGVSYSLINPQLIDAAEALEQLPRRRRAVLGRLDISQYLALTHTTVAEAQPPVETPELEAVAV